MLRSSDQAPWFLLVCAAVSLKFRSEYGSCSSRRLGGAIHPVFEGWISLNLRSSIRRVGIRGGCSSIRGVGTPGEFSVEGKSFSGQRSC